jgi:multiple sugar transport system permease protein
MTMASQDTLRPARAPAPLRRKLVPDRFLPYGMIGPAVFVAFAIAIVPLAYAFWLSLQDWYMLRRPTPVWGGLANYRQLLQDGALWAAFGRTWIWMVGTVFVELLLALPIALLLNRESAIARSASALILLPWVTPFIVLGFGWRFLLDSDVGPIHGFLNAIGIAGDSSVLNDPVLAFTTIIFISGWKGTPFLVIALLAALKSIPEELYEAAEVDGAGPVSRFLHVTLPEIWNTIVTVGLVLGILAFYSFDLPWIMTKGGPQDATTIVGIAMYKAVFLDLRPAYAAAISIVMLVLLFLASLVVLRARRKV